MCWSRQRRLDGLQAAAEHLPQLRGVLVAVLGDGMCRCRGEDLVFGAGDGERAVDLAGYLAAVDHLAGHDGLPSPSAGVIPAASPMRYPDLPVGKILTH